MLVAVEGQDGAGKTAVLEAVHGLLRSSGASLAVGESSESPYGRVLLEAVAMLVAAKPIADAVREFMAFHEPTSRCRGLGSSDDRPYVDFGSGPASTLLNSGWSPRSGPLEAAWRRYEESQGSPVGARDRALTAELSAGRRYALVRHRDRYAGGPWAVYSDPEGCSWAVRFALAVRRAPHDSDPAAVLSAMGVGAPRDLTKVLDAADLDDTVWAAYLFSAPNHPIHNPTGGGPTHPHQRVGRAD
jgi:hypothetical protein